MFGRKKAEKAILITPDLQEVASVEKPKTYNYVERIAVKVEIDDLSKQIDDLNLRAGELSAKVRTMRDDWQIAPADQWHDTRWIRLCIETIAGIDYNEENRLTALGGCTYSYRLDDCRRVLTTLLAGMIADREAKEKTAK